MFIIPAAGFLFFSYTYISGKYETKEKVVQLSSMVDYVGNVVELVHQLQKERGLSAGYLGKKEVKFTEALKKQYPETNRAFEQFKAIIYDDVRLNEEHFSFLVKNILMSLESLPGFRKQILAKTVTFRKEISYYTTTITTLIDTISLINRKNYLALPVFSKIEALSSLIYLKEYAALERGYLTYILSNQTLSLPQREMLQNLESKQEFYRRKFHQFASFKLLKRFHQEVPPDLDMKLHHYIEQAFISEVHLQSLDSKEWFEAATERIEKYNRIIGYLLEHIRYQSREIANETNRELWTMVALWFLTFMALLFLVILLKKVLEKEESNFRQVAEQSRQFVILNAVTENLIRARNEKHLYAKVCKILTEKAHFESAWIGKIDLEKDSIVPVVTQNIPFSRLKKVSFVLDAEKAAVSDFPERVYWEKRIVTVDLLSEKCRTVLGDTIQASAAFPVFMGETMVAVLVLHTAQADTFSPVIQRLIQKVVWELETVLKRIDTEKKLLASNEALRISSYAFEAQEAMVITDIDANIVKVNSAFTKITGYEADEVLGKNPKILQSSEHDKAFYRKMWHDLEHQGKWKGEIINRRKSGETYPELLSITAIKNRKGVTTHYIAQFLDISRMRKAQKEAEHKALHDVLTGIANRTNLMEQTQVAFEQGREYRLQHAFIFLDIDNFKQINDFYGHDMGDMILRSIAHRLDTIAQKVGVAGRLGGDEFVLLALNLPENEHKAAQEATHIAQEIQQSMLQPIQAGSQLFEITFSIGIKLFPDHEKSYKEVITHADIAMYQAKKTGKNQFVFFNHELDLESKRLVILENGLKQAIRQKEFMLYFQPKIDLATEEVIGAEALIRWNHPTKGVVTPEYFIDIANDTKLITQIDDFVLEEACKTLVKWKNEYSERAYTLSVNISFQRFQKQDFVASVIEKVERYDIDPSALELELLEDTFIADLDGTVEKIKQLRMLGIRFAIDDFGTGYSSLTYLQKLPIDTIKIDKTFIMNLESRTNKEIVKMIINFAKIFEMDIVAEGVESKKALAFLKEILCNQYQGYYFSRPVSAEEMDKLLESIEEQIRA